MPLPRSTPAWGTALALACLTTFVSPSPARAAEQWAVLIGVQEHEVAAYNLRYPVRDVSALEKVLLTRAGFDHKHVLRMTDDSAPELRPTLENLRREVPRFLKRARPGDRVLVFYSGHGILVGEKTSLVPRDFRKEMAEQTGLAVADLRKWLSRDGCQAAVKFLILDCCHSAADEAAKSLDSEEVARAVDVEDIPGAVVLASCRGREKSYEWPERQQGLFTFWLCRALEGAATNGDGNVSFDLLNKYVHEHVTALSRLLFRRLQTPVRYGQVEGDPPVLVLTPETEATFCRRIAEDLDVDVRRKKLPSVGVFEFYLPQGLRAEELGRAPLPRYLAEQVQKHLKGLAGTDYAVVGFEAMAESVKDIGVEKVRSPEQLPEVGRRGHPEGIVFGEIRQLPARYSVQCTLVNTQSGQELGRAGGVLALRPERLGDFGQSGDFRESPPGGPFDPGRVRFARRQASQGHPLLDPGFPFRVEVWSGGQKKEFTVVNQKSGEEGQVRSECTVGAVKGEEFEVRVLNGSDKRVGVRLLVDGFNTLDQVRQLTDEGRAWVLPPSKEPYHFEGWYFRKGGGAEKGPVPYELRRFKFVDVGESVAARNNFTQGIGLITAAFFDEGGRTIAVGEANEKVRTELKETPFRFGKCLGIVQVRYVEEKK
jgi:hypothetical protein